MKKSKKMMMRFIATVMTVVLALNVTTATAFAADVDAQQEMFAAQAENTKSAGSILVSGSANFTTTVTIPLYLSSGNWSADCLAVVTGNPGVQYQVTVTTPSGSTTTGYITSNAGTFTNIVTLVYAGSGTYTFKFTRLGGTAKSAHAVAEICD